MGWWTSDDVGGPLGRVTLLADHDLALTHVLLDGWVADLPDGCRRDDEALRPVVEQLREYAAGARQLFDVPLAPVGTAFQRAVRAALLDVPYGQTRTYGQVAEVLGRPTATRAVGAANGANPLAVVVPCHRVVGADGLLTGYAGGLERKRLLLDHERRHAGVTSAGVQQLTLA